MSTTTTFKKIYFALPIEIRNRIGDIVKEQNLSDAQSKHLNAGLLIYAVTSKVNT